MPDPQSSYEQALALIDKANAKDPNQVQADGQNWPKELLYSERMSSMLQRYNSDADDVMKLAIRSQHIERWKSPRNSYPMNRIGYLSWRKALYKIQANTAITLMTQAGYSEADCDRTWRAVAKKNIKGNPDTQLLEDVSNLCFIEHYLLEFVAKHIDYSEDKWIEIIAKTWAKMSNEAHDFILAGKIKLPESLAALILKAVTPT